MVLDKPFTTASPALVNYSRTDIQTGVGYTDYYLIKSQTSGGADYHLTTNNDYSTDIAQSGTAAFDFDFDLSPFTIAQTINGTALVSLAVWGQSSTTPTWTVELYKWDGTTETQMGSTITFAPALIAAKMLSLPIEVVNTTIAVGEVLRLRVAATDTGASSKKLGYDPANRSDGAGALTITTTSKVSIPYKLDL